MSRPPIAEFGRRPTATSTRSNTCGPPGAFFPSKRDGQTLLVVLHAGHFRLEENRLAYVCHALGDHRREIAIGARQQAVGHLDNGHLRSQRGVHRPKLEPDVPAADDQQTIRHVRQLERGRRIEHLRAVDRHVRHRRRARSGRDDDVVGLDLLLASRGFDAQRLRIHERRAPLDVGHLTRFREQSEPAGLLLDDVIFPRAKLVDVDRRLAERHAEHVGVLGFVEHPGRVQQRLRRDASAERADAAGIRIGVDERHLHAGIGRMKRGDVAARARANDC